MDCAKVGQLICRLRREKQMTQKQVADKLNISAKTVSKWECGYGMPDISVLGELSEILNVNIEKILLGDMEQNRKENGNMKKIKFYVCPVCGSIITETGNAEISCCGRRLTALTPSTGCTEHEISTQNIENEIYITINHEMTKEHYISFIAYVKFDRIILIRLYPEQTAETRIPQMGSGKLYCCCTKHGLFEYDI